MKHNLKDNFGRFQHAALSLKLPLTCQYRTLLVQPLQGSLNGELALTANSMGSELYNVF